MTAEILQAAAAAAHEKLPDMGFILIVTTFGADAAEAKAHYISNCNREDAVKILKTLLFRWGINEEWMKECK